MHVTLYWAVIERQVPTLVELTATISQCLLSKCTKCAQQVQGIQGRGNQPPPSGGGSENVLRPWPRPFASHPKASEEARPHHADGLVSAVGK